MAEEGATHPGSWLGDAVEEYKKAPPAAKIGIVVALVAAAGIGYYEYSKNKSSSPNSTIGGGQTGGSTDTSGASANPFPTVPGGNTGQVAFFPFGAQPIYDPNGNLVGFEPLGGTTAGQGSTAGSTTGTGTGGTKTGGTGGKKKGKGNTGGTSGGSKQHTTGHAGSHWQSGHTVKQHQSNAQSSTSTTVVHHTKQQSAPPQNKIQPHNTGGSHGYVYTTKPGDTISKLQGTFFPTSNTSTQQGNITYYGNNKQIFSQQGLITKNGTVKVGQQIKPGTRILA